MLSLVKQIFSLVRHLLVNSLWRFTHLFTNKRAVAEPLTPSTERIRHMDEDLPEDIEDVLELSAYLEIREYDFFDLAYRWWFGRVPNRKNLERHFARYMFNKIVPHWVRNYCRMIFDLQMEGKFNKEELGISRLPDATPQSVRAGLRYFAMLITVMGLLLLIAELVVQFSVLPCMFPPCY